MKGARRYAIAKITDRPRKRLNAMVDLREEVMKLSSEISIRVDALYTLLKNQQYEVETDQGLLEIDMHQYM